MLVGIPGSGKSRYAKRRMHFNKDTVHIESDAIREELFNGKQGKEETKEVFEVMFLRTMQALEQDLDVIYDATNVSYKDRRRLLNSTPKDVRKECFAIITPIDVCKARNSQRENPVPEEVIDRMVKRFNYPLASEGFDYIGFINGNTRFSKDVEKSTGFMGDIDVESLLAFIKGESAIPAWEGLSDHQLSIKLFRNLARITPEFHKITGLAQDNPNHTFSVSMHMYHVWKDVLRQKEMYEGSEGYELVDWDSLAVSALLHDIGKGFTKEFKDAKGNSTKFAHYYNHENVSAYLSVIFSISMINILSEYAVNIGKVATLVQFHMKAYPYAKNEKKWKKLIDDETTFLELGILNEADKNSK